MSEAKNRDTSDATEVGEATPVLARAVTFLAELAENANHGPVIVNQIKAMTLADDIVAWAEELRSSVLAVATEDAARNANNALCFHAAKGKRCTRYLNGSEAERAQTVAWLRSLPRDEWYPANVADAIERGDADRGTNSDQSKTSGGEAAPLVGEEPACTNHEPARGPEEAGTYLCASDAPVCPVCNGKGEVLMATIKSEPTTVRCDACCPKCRICGLPATHFDAGIGRVCGYKHVAVTGLSTDYAPAAVDTVRAIRQAIDHPGGGDHGRVLRIIAILDDTVLGTEPTQKRSEG